MNEQGKQALQQIRDGIVSRGLKLKVSGTNDSFGTLTGVAFELESGNETRRTAVAASEESGGIEPSSVTGLLNMMAEWEAKQAT